jgi:hypothetical protein
MARCSLYSSDGPLMSEGSCEMHEGTVEMVAERWHMTPTVGGAPATLVMEGGGQYHVTIEDVHVLQSDAAAGPREAYRLMVLDDSHTKERGGLIGGLKSMFSR